MAAATHCKVTKMAILLGQAYLINVKPGMQSYEEEIFGPVLQVVRTESLEEAAALAEQSPIRKRRRNFHAKWPRSARIRKPRLMLEWSV